MLDLLNVAFVGCGRHACDSLLPALQYVPEINLRAVCDRDESRAIHAAQHFGARGHFTDTGAMYREATGLHAVVISVGGHAHAALAQEALEAGLHVLVEKPPALSSAQALDVVEACRRTGRHVAVAFKKRFCPVYAKARQIAREDSFGPLSRIDIKFDMGMDRAHLPSVTSEGFTEKHASTHLEISIHMLDLARFLGGEIASVFSECGRNCTQVCAVTYEGGAIGTFSFGRAQSGQGPKERVEITGSGASVLVENQIRLTHFRPARDTSLEGTYIVEEDRAPVLYEPQFSLSSRANKALFYGGYVGELQHFAQSLLGGRVPSPSIEDGVAALRLVETMAESVGTRVSPL